MMKTNNKKIMKTVERYLWDVALAIALFVSIGMVVHSCYSCRQEEQRLQESREYDMPNVVID